MAEITPVKVSELRDGTQSSYVDNSRGDYKYQASAAVLKGLPGLTHSMFYFENVGASDTWASGIKNIRMVAFTALNSTKGASATYSGSTITLKRITTDTPEGILHVWHGV